MSRKNATKPLKSKEYDVDEIIEISKKVSFQNARMGQIIADEDLRQEYLTRLLEGRHRHATVNQAVVDIYRETIADPRASDFRARVSASHNPLEVEDWYISQDPIEELNNRLTLNCLINALSEREVLVVKKFLSGMNFNEISKDLEVTESRAHQIFKIIVAKLQRAANRTPIVNAPDKLGTGDVTLSSNKPSFRPYLPHKSFAFEYTKKNVAAFKQELLARAKEMGGMAWLAKESKIHPSNLYSLFHKLETPMRRPTISKLSGPLNFSIEGTEALPEAPKRKSASPDLAEVEQSPSTILWTCCHCDSQFERPARPKICNRCYKKNFITGIPLYKTSAEDGAPFKFSMDSYVSDRRGFQDALKKIMDEKGGILWLAKKSGIHVNNLRRVLNFNIKAHNSTLKKIFEALDTQMDGLT